MSEKPEQQKVHEGYITVDGVVRLEKHDFCRRGHPTTQVGWGRCPTCGGMTMRWYCADLRCDGGLVPDNHQCGKSAS